MGPDKKATPETLATVVSGVFLDQHRPLVFLTVSVLAIGFLTVTYEGWAARRRSHGKATVGRRKLETLKAELTESLDVLRTTTREHEHAHLVSRQDLEDAPAGFDAERAEVERFLDLHDKALAKARAAVEPRVDADPLPHETRLSRLTDLRATAKRCCKLLKGRGKSLERAVQVLEAAGRDAGDQLRQQRSALVEILGEASAVEHEARATMEEGGEHPERVELEQALSRLSEARHEPEHSNGAGQPQNGDLRSAVSAAEHHSRTLAALVDLLRDTMERLRAAMNRAREREQLAAEGSEPIHCLACGEALPPDHRFCASCGTSRPLDIGCSACGSTTRLPQHILSEEWGSAAIHCSLCGELVSSGDAEPESEPQPPV